MDAAFIGGALAVVAPVRRAAHLCALRAPRGVCQLPSGLVAVCDEGNGRVAVVSPWTGAFIHSVAVGALASHGGLVPKSRAPVAVALLADRTVVVTQRGGLECFRM